MTPPGDEPSNGSGDTPEDAPGSSADLERDLVRTRHELDDTIGALQRRLAPQRLRQEAEDAVRSSVRQSARTARDNAKKSVQQTRTHMLDTIKKNPIPSLLTGIGLTWLVARGTTPSGNSPQGRSSDRYEGDRYYEGPPRRDAGRREPEGHSASGLVTPQESYASRTPREQARYEHMRQQVQQSPEDEAAAKKQIEETVSKAKEEARKAAEKADKTEDQIEASVKEAAHTARQEAEAAQRQASDAARRAGHAASNAASQVGEAASSAASQAGQATSEAGRQVRDTAGQAGRAVGHAASEAGHQVQQTANQAGRKAKKYGRQAQHQAGRAQTQLESWVYDNPLAVGAATIALGTFAGLMAPGTRRENELMGRRRDQAVHQAQGYASEAVERGQRAVKQTVEETAKETANEAIETALDTNDEE